MAKDQSGPNHWNWKGGISWSQGYCFIWKPGYHRAHKNYAKRADLVLEEKLGRLLLPNEIAHHKNFDRSDDSSDNLEPVDSSEHRAENCRQGAADGVFTGSHASQPRDKKGKFQ